MGMINRQQKFIQNLSEKTMPLRGLFSSKNEWHCGQAQEESFLEDEERHDPSGSCRSLLLRERNYHICERLVV